jgi:hypothetical protein
MSDLPNGAASPAPASGTVPGATPREAPITEREVAGVLAGLWIRMTPRTAAMRRRQRP